MSNEINDTNQVTSEDSKTNKFSKVGENTSSRFKKWQHNFVSLKMTRQVHLLVSLLLFIGLIFGGAIEKIVILLVAIPLAISGLTGKPFLENLAAKMPWNKAHKATLELKEENPDLNV